MRFKRLNFQLAGKDHLGGAAKKYPLFSYFDADLATAGGCLVSTERGLP